MIHLRFFHTLPPRSRLLLAGLIVLALLLTAFVYIEVTQSREELLDSVRAESLMLIESLNRGSEITITAGAELDEALIDRLLLAARIVDQLQESRRLTAGELAGEVNELGLRVALLFDRNGRLTLSSSQAAEHSDFENSSQTLRTEVLEPVLDGDYVWKAEGRVYCPWTGDTLFVIAHELRNNTGALVLGVSSDDLLNIRKRLGIGKLVQDIGNAENIAYILLQDARGILTASRGIREMTSIDEDAFLQDVLAGESAQTRIVDYADDRVFEVVKKLDIVSDLPILSRIGLSLERVRTIQQRSMRRVIFIAVGFFVTAAILLVLLLTRQRFALLAEEHQKIRTYTGLVLDNIADAVVAIDAAGRITVFNKAAEQLFAIAASEALNQDAQALLPNDPLLLERTAERGSAVDFEDVAVSATGDGLRYLVVSTSIIRDRKGGVETIVSIARDFTEQRRAQEQLERRDRLTAMGELAGGIAHEIRNPLNAISIIAQRFQMEFTPQSDTKEYETLTRTIRSEVKRVNGIITQFLEFARPSRLSLEKIRVSELLRNSVDVVGSQARAKGISIEVIADETLTIHADSGKMQQVFLNLLQNAIDAIENEGEIKCIACRNEGKLMVSIADNGPGIPRERQSKVFDLYFTTKSSGTGLGLSIVHQIVSEHGGELSVTSEEGHGSTFHILLPQAK
jgi:PAS domain S-box-containing protein